MVQKKDTSFLASAFAKVANNQRHWDQWLVADVWATLINDELNLQGDMKVTGANLCLSLIRSLKYKSIMDVVDIYNTPNIFGLFRSKISKVTAFYITSPSSCPKLNHHMPGGNTKFVREVVATIPTRASTAINNTTTDLPSTTPSMPPPLEVAECHPRKKARRWMTLPAEQLPQQRGRFSDGQFGSTSNLRKRKTAPDANTTTELDAPPPPPATEASTTTELDAAPPPAINITALEILNQDYFDSPEANILFGVIVMNREGGIRE
jgi:hypothetical protein